MLLACLDDDDDDDDDDDYFFLKDVIKYKLYFIIQCVKVCVIPWPHQPPTRGDITDLVAKGVLPLAAFATGKGKTNRAKVFLCSLNP